MRKLYKVELLHIATFKEGKFMVRNDGKNYNCTFENKNAEWDKLYDHMMGLFIIAAEEVAPNEFLVYEVY